MTKHDACDIWLTQESSSDAIGEGEGSGEGYDSAPRADPRSLSCYQRGTLFSLAWTFISGVMSFTATSSFAASVLSENLSEDMDLARLSIAVNAIPDPAVDLGRSD